MRTPVDRLKKVIDFPSTFGEDDLLQGDCVRPGLAKTSLHRGGFLSREGEGPGPCRISGCTLCDQWRTYHK